MTDFWNEGSGGGQLDVAAMLDSQVPELLAELLELGPLVSMGKTRDGGAMGFTVTLDGQWRRTYVRSSEELVEFIRSATVAVAATPRDAPASSGQRGRSRRL